MAGAAIEAGAARALGVETRVGWVRIRLLAGEFRLAGLSVDNPPGFESDHFLTLQAGHFELRPGSLREAVIELPRFELEGVDVRLEKAAGRSNYAAILDHLRDFSRDVAPSGPGTAGGRGGGKRLIVRELVIRDVRAEYDLGAVAGSRDRGAVSIPEIRLRGLGAAGSRGASIAEVSQAVVQALLTALARQAPAELSASLLRGLGGLGRLPLEIRGLADRELAEGAGRAVGELGRGAAGALGGAARSTREALGRIGGALTRGGDE